jgi:hypothetical protein
MIILLLAILFITLILNFLISFFRFLAYIFKKISLSHTLEEYGASSVVVNGSKDQVGVFRLMDSFTSKNFKKLTFPDYIDCKIESYNNNRKSLLKSFARLVVNFIILFIIIKFLQV